MAHSRLSVLVRVDLTANHVRLVVTGCLTEINQHALHPLVRRARALVPGIRVVVDLGRVRHFEAAAVELLRRAVEHDSPEEPAGTAEIVVPGRPARTGTAVLLPVRTDFVEEVAA